MNLITLDEWGYVTTADEGQPIHTPIFINPRNIVAIQTATPSSPNYANTQIYCQGCASPFLVWDKVYEVQAKLEAIGVT